MCANKKSICFCITDISACGGTERVTLRIANELCSRGYEVHILTLSTKEPPFFSFDKRIKFHTLLLNTFDRRLIHKKYYKIWKLRKILNRIKVRYVVDTTLSDTIAIAMQKRKEYYITWIHFTHDVSTAFPPHKNAVYLNINDKRHFITITEADRTAYIKEGVSPEKIKCIYNPLSFETSDSKHQETKRVISLGRFSPEKGFDLLLDAWKIVEKYNNDYRLEIWGDDGRYKHKLIEKIDSMGLKRATLHGVCSNVESLLKESSIYVLSSRSEAFGLVLTEAATCGLPLIAFDAPNGPREIIENGKNGLLVPAEDTQSMAQAILRLINNEDYRINMGKMAKEMSRRFSIENIGDQWESFLSEINGSQN